MRRPVFGLDRDPGVVADLQPSPCIVTEYAMTEEAVLQSIRDRIKADAERVTASGPVNVADLAPELVPVFRLLLMATRSIENAPAAHPLLTDAQIQISDAINALPRDVPLYEDDELNGRIPYR